MRILIAAGGWRWIFLINLPVGLIALAWSRFFPSDPNVRDSGGRLDVRGQALAVAFFALVVVIVEAGERSSVAAWALIRMTCAVVALYWSDRRSAAPRSLSGRVVAARGPQLPAVLGQIAAVAGSAAIAAAIFVDASLWVLICAMLLAGMALPMVIVPMTGLVVSGAPAGAAGVSGGLFSASRQLGGAFGVAALGSVLASVGGADGAAWAMLAAAVIAGDRSRRDDVSSAPRGASSVRMRPTMAASTASIWVWPADSLH